jgi:hypothetical protein
MGHRWTTAIPILLLGLAALDGVAQSEPAGRAAPSPQAPAATAMHASYETYAAGMKVADVAAGFSFGPWTYQMAFAYRTTGLVGFFFRGHEHDTASGAWKGDAAAPVTFLGQGLWRGLQREVRLAYQQGHPMVQALIPPNDGEREDVPEAQRTNTIDSISALAQLVHVVAATGRCDTSVHTYDGRREVEITAHTAGEEQLAPTDRSSFAGKALRCDFEGRLIAGFKHDDDRTRAAKPMHGSAWLAPAGAGGMMLPVRLSFQTRWFGDATMYLTDVGPGASVTLADGN